MIEQMDVVVEENNVTPVVEELPTSIVVFQHDEDNLAVWASGRSIKIWNFSLRQHAIDLFKKHVTHFVNVNQYHMLSMGNANAYRNVQLEGTNVLHDRVTSLTNVLMDRNHYRSMWFKYPVVKIFVCEGKSTYIICNVVTDGGGLIDTSQSTSTSTSSSNLEVHIRDLDNDHIVRTFPGMALYVGDICGFSCKVLVLASINLLLLFKNLDTGETICKFNTDFNGIHMAVVCPGQTTWLAVNDEPNITVHNLTKGLAEELKREKRNNQTDVATTSVTRIVQRVVAYRLFTGDEEDGEISEFAMLSDINGQILVSAHDSGIVRVWDLCNHLLLRVFDFGEHGVHTVALKGGPRPLLVTGSYFGAVDVWSLLSGTHRQTLQRSNQEIAEGGEPEDNEPCFALAIGQSDAYLDAVVSVDMAGKLSVWDLRPAVWTENWEVRRSFCLFLSGCRLLEKHRRPTTERLQMSGEEGETSTTDMPELATVVAFATVSVCKRIASFL